MLLALPHELSERSVSRVPNSNSMTPILFISYYFPPTGGAPAQRSLKFARYLPGEGYLPIILTGPGTSHNEWTPHDASLIKELPPTVPIYRIQDPVPQQGGKLLRRAERWFGLSSPFSRWWISSATQLAEQALVAGGAKLIYATMSPFESADVAAYLSQKHRIPWVADLRDPWAIDEIQVYPSVVHKAMALRKMRRLLSSATAVIMNTPEATALFKRTFPCFQGKRIVTVTNGFDPEDLNGVSPPQTKSKFTIVHTGSFLTDSGLRLRRRRRFYEGLGGAVPGVDIATRSHLLLFEAIHRWCVLDPSVKENIQIVFAGNSPLPDASNSKEKGVLAFTRFAGYLPRDESLGLVRAADLLFLAMHNLPAGRRSTTAPSKMFEYMASGRPILAAVPDGDAKDFLVKVGTAFICRPDDVEGMVQALSQAYDMWKTGIQTPAPNREFLRAFERRTLTRFLAREFDAALGANSQ